MLLKNVKNIVRMRMVVSTGGGKNVGKNVTCMFLALLEVKIWHLEKHAVRFITDNFQNCRNGI